MQDLILNAINRGMKVSARIESGQWQYTGTRDGEVVLFITRNKFNQYTVVTNKL